MNTSRFPVRIKNMTVNHCSARLFKLNGRMNAIGFFFLTKKDYLRFSVYTMGHLKYSTLSIL